MTTTVHTDRNEEKEKGKEFIIEFPYAIGIEVLKWTLKKLRINLYFSYRKKLNSLVTSNIKRLLKSVVYQIKGMKVGLETGSKQHDEVRKKITETPVPKWCNIMKNGNNVCVSIRNHHLY